MWFAWNGVGGKGDEGEIRDMGDRFPRVGESGRGVLRGDMFASSGGIPGSGYAAGFCICFCWWYWRVCCATSAAGKWWYGLS